MELCIYPRIVLFVMQKTAYEMRISDWSSDVCSSDLKLFAQQNTDANGFEIFNGDAEKGIPQTARADRLRDEPERFRDPLQVMRCVLKLHREMPIVTKAVCGVNG